MHVFLYRLLIFFFKIIFFSNFFMEKVLYFPDSENRGRCTAGCFVHFVQTVKLSHRKLSSISFYIVGFTDLTIVSCGTLFG